MLIHFQPVFHFYNPQNIRKPEVSWYLQGVYKWNIALRWAGRIPVTTLSNLTVKHVKYKKYFCGGKIHQITKILIDNSLTKILGFWKSFFMHISIVSFNGMLANKESTSKLAITVLSWNFIRKGERILTKWELNVLPVCM